MKYSLFLGCTLPVRGQNYELSTRKVCEVLGIELKDNAKFLCCGFPLNAVDHEAALLFSAYNIAVAENEDLDIMTMCAACTGILTETNHKLKEDEQLRVSINEKLADFGLEYKGNISVKHFARVLYEDYGLENIKKKIKKKLIHFEFAPHYGCHYIKPSAAFDNFDDPENPTSLDQLIKVTGAKSINYEDKLSCCGGGILGIEEETALQVAKEKLGYVKKRGAQAMILLCPFCNVMYEQNQKKMERKFEQEYDIPIIYYSQILGLALGLTPQELGFNINLIKPRKLLELSRASC
jgi:heterodisulfide reductase subunit B